VWIFNAGDEANSKETHSKSIRRILDSISTGIEVLGRSGDLKGIVIRARIHCHTLRALVHDPSIYILGVSEAAEEDLDRVIPVCGYLGWG
jgi:hypothetical protein